MSRPLLTFALFAYKQERFIGEAIEGALAQTYSPLEIILSDDCSADRTFEIMQQRAGFYRGPHTIILNRNDRNLGIAGHVNRVVELARGELIIGAAGDDVSLPERTAKIYAEWEASERKALSIHSQAYRIDEKGERVELFDNPFTPDYADLARVVRNHRWVTGSTHAWHRRVFAVFGPIANDVVGEDHVIPFRSALLGEVRYIKEPLVEWRAHPKSISRLPNPGESIDSLHCRYRTLSERLVPVLTQHLQDLRRSGQDRPALKRAILETLEVCRYRSAITYGSSCSKLCVIAEALRQRVPVGIILKEAAKFLFPAMYITMLRMRSAARG